MEVSRNTSCFLHLMDVLFSSLIWRFPFVTTDRWRPQEFLPQLDEFYCTTPQLDEFYFTTVEKKILENWSGPCCTSVWVTEEDLSSVLSLSSYPFSSLGFLQLLFSVKPWNPVHGCLHSSVRWRPLSGLILKFCVNDVISNLGILRERFWTF